MGIVAWPAGRSSLIAATDAGMLTNSDTRLSASGSGCCTSMSWVVTLAMGVVWTSTDTIPAPGHTDPAWHRAQGLVPEEVPCDE